MALWWCSPRPGRGESRNRAESGWRDFIDLLFETPATTTDTVRLDSQNRTELGDFIDAPCLIPVYLGSC